MDTIEKSNLSRQLLFRAEDLGKFKSEAAGKRIAGVSKGRTSVQSFNKRVNDLSVFNDEFWRSPDLIVANALDNLDARIYVDAQCVGNRVHLVDSGTLGSKMNVQVVVPGRSESYASSADPPEENIAVCTVKNFPYEIEHCVNWAKVKFEELFRERIKRCLEWKGGEEEGEEEGEEGHIREIYDDVKCAISQNSDSDSIEAIEFAINLYHANNEELQGLLDKYPVDAVDEEDGKPFWGGNRRRPTILEMGVTEEIDTTILTFIRTVARLRLANFGKTDDALDEVDIAVDVIGARKKNGANMSNDKLADLVAKMKSHSPCNPIDLVLKPITFEKDDDTNGHVDMIAAATNLRAKSYGICTATSLDVRRIAGNIVPAMITSTSVVGALATVELIKIGIGKGEEENADGMGGSANYFGNLANNFFASSRPVECEKIEGLGGKFTLWDRLVIDGGGEGEGEGEGEKQLTLKRFLKKVEKRARASAGNGKVRISSVTFGKYIIFMDFVTGEGDKKVGLKELIERAVNEEDEDDEGGGGGRGGGRFSRSAGEVT